jgi:hypothetical protein
MDREHKAHGQAIKDIYVYPVIRDAIWCTFEHPESSEAARIDDVPGREEAATPGSMPRPFPQPRPQSPAPVRR